ncbi:MAG: N-acetylmuramoyl-L-alanine amidase [Sphingobacteriales bacterium]|nr:N-acetylmuramoyl-L-alanine amidase [Sphingobacteriales bacterium]
MQLKTPIRCIKGFFLLLMSCPSVLPVSAQLSEKQTYSDKTVIKGPADVLKNIADNEVFKKDSAAATSKYATANYIYYRMIDSMARSILQYPLQDSAGLPYATDWVGTTNMGLRRPNYVIIHHTATNGHEEVIQDFTTLGGREASSHYLICKDGTVYHMLNDLLRSHHAGESKWGNTTDLNSSSIGIEIVNNGNQAFTDEQINSLIILLGRLKTTYKIPDANFLGHGDIAPIRKVDPNPQFPWKLLSEKGFGLWWDDTSNIEVPDNFDYLLGLRIIGYDISYPASAVAAFKRHFMQDGSGGNMNADIRKVIYAVCRKYL